RFTSLLMTAKPDLVNMLFILEITMTIFPGRVAPPLNLTTHMFAECQQRCYTSQCQAGDNELTAQTGRFPHGCSTSSRSNISYNECTKRQSTWLSSSLPSRSSKTGVMPTERAPR